MQVGKRGRERSDTRGRDLSARDDSIHSTTLGSVCIVNSLVRQEMSRTPSCTMQYFDLTGQRDSLRGLKPERCIGNLSSRRFWRQPFWEHPAGIDWQTTPSWNPNGARWLGASDLPKCRSAYTSSDTWRGPAGRLIKKHIAPGSLGTGRAEWITYNLQRTQTGSRWVTGIQTLDQR